MLDIILRILTILAFSAQWIYWGETEKVANKEKPKTQKSQTLYKLLSKIAFKIIYWSIIAQVVGISIFPISNAILIQLIGVILVIVGIAIMIFSRKELSTNWAPGYEYQIKEKHTLITTGIYKYIRHPIYLGIALSFIGAEMVAASYLFISMFAIFVGVYVQGKREEKILLAHFGENYKKYMSQTKMLIPCVW